MLKRTLFVTLILMASASFASDPKRLSVLLGHPTTLSLPDEVSSVTLSNPSKIEVTKSGRKVTLLGVEKGTTEVAIKTAGGGTTKMNVYVAADKYALPY